MSETNEQIVFLGDVHVPYHSKEALAEVYNYIDFFKPDRIFLIGDIIDFYQLSHFNKNAFRMHELQDDIDKCFEVLTDIRSVAGDDCNITYLAGNHEIRLGKYLADKPELNSLRCLDFVELMQLEKLSISYKDYKSPINHKGFIIEHGCIVRQNSAYTAKGMLDRRQMSGICGHTHRMGKVYKTSYNGTKVWVENGCLCNQKVCEDYIVGIPDWQQGFSTAEFNDSGLVRINQYDIGALS